MNLKECYASIGADYESVFLRMGSDSVICKFLFRYFDRNEYNGLEKAICEKRWKDAFMYAHNMKGFALNMSLTRLAGASSVLCEALRNGQPEDGVSGMLADVKSAYVITEKAVGNLERE